MHRIVSQLRWPPPSDFFAVCSTYGLEEFS
jgi:hypothetical protein